MSQYPNSTKFWNASEAWWRSRLAAQQKNAAEGNVRADVDAARKEAKWKKLDISKYFRSGRKPNQLSMIRVDPGLQTQLLDAVGAVQPEVVRAFDEVLPGLVTEAWKKWPVATGLSRSLLSLEYSAQGDRFIGTIASRAPYTYFIKGHPHRALLDQPGENAAKQIGVRIVVYAARAMGKGGRR